MSPFLFVLGLDGAGQPYAPALAYSISSSNPCICVGGGEARWTLTSQKNKQNKNKQNSTNQPSIKIHLPSSFFLQFFCWDCLSLFDGVLEGAVDGLFHGVLEGAVDVLFDGE